MYDECTRGQNIRSQFPNILSDMRPGWLDSICLGAASIYSRTRESQDEGIADSARVGG